MSVSAPTPARFVSDTVLNDLLQCLIHRNFTSGFAILTPLVPLLDELDLQSENTQRFIGRFALYVDAGFPGRPWLCDVLAKFTDDIKGKLPFHRCGCVRLAQSVADFLEGNFAEAAQELSVILDANLIESGDLRIIARYMLARSLKRDGRYEPALREAQHALELAHRAGLTEITAIIRVMLAWLHFQAGRRSVAGELLKASREVLAATEDHAGKGSFESLSGRMLRRSGEHRQACECYEKAERHFVAAPGQHRNLIRVWVNRAFDTRLLALQLERGIKGTEQPERHQGTAPRIDSEYPQLQALIDELAVSAPELPALFHEPAVEKFVRTLYKAASERRRATAEGRGQVRRRVEELRADARRFLDQASAAAVKFDDARQSGMVELYRGYLLLDEGCPDDASAAALGALNICRAGDHLLRARVMLLQTMIAFDIAEQDESRARWEFALQLAGNARRCADQTTVPRLIGKTILYQALCSARIGDHAKGREFQKDAVKRLNALATDYISYDLIRLNKMLSDSADAKTRVNALLDSLASGEGDWKTAAWEFFKAVVSTLWPRFQTIDGVTRRLKTGRANVKEAAEELGLRERHRNHSD